MKFIHEPRRVSSQPEIYVKPVYTKDNKHEVSKFEILSDVLTAPEAAALKEFILDKLPNAQEGESAQQHVLPYRTDEWDSEGVIDKLQGVAKDHIRDTFYMDGSVEPRKFMLLRSDTLQSYFEKYSSSYINNREILYTAVVTPVYGEKDYSGETLYTSNGEGFVPKALNMVVHRNEDFNSWSIGEVLDGTRLDLVMVFREVDMGISYDYKIDQSPEDEDGEF